MANTSHKVGANCHEDRLLANHLPIAPVDRMVERRSRSTRPSQDAARTAAEECALWWLLNGPNLLIEIPVTLAGPPDITEMLTAGIFVNVTRIFPLECYRAVLDAFLAGLEQRVDKGGLLKGLNVDRLE